jgi:hypothetical protein
MIFLLQVTGIDKEANYDTSGIAVQAGIELLTGLLVRKKT